MKYNLRDILFHLKHGKREKWYFETQEEFEDKIKEQDDKFENELHDAVKENIEFFKQLQSSINIDLIIHVDTLHDYTFNKIVEIKKAFNSAATGVFGLHYDNQTNIQIKRNVVETGYFNLSVHSLSGNLEGVMFVSLYDQWGTENLYSATVDNTDKFSTIYKDIIKVMENWDNDIINCSDCGKEITHQEVAGRYFAGKYCRECWEGKWKEIEAKETYN
jgi:hypothetical protein